jgi:catechol 2,3-dioxygenase-like lactoylglutathione lyase family enzyme
VLSLSQVVLDSTDIGVLAEFYRGLLGYDYREGSGPTDPDSAEWLALQNPAGGCDVAFQQVAELAEPTWPDGPRPQMAHLDLMVATPADLDAEHDRAVALGARLLQDRSTDPDEPLRVYADPSGHPFCIFLSDR